MAPSASAPSEKSFGSEPVDVSSPLSLIKAVHARRAEFTRRHRIRIKIGTWNVAACPGTDKDLASWFVHGEGIDEDLAGLDLSKNTAVDHSNSSTDGDTDHVRLIGGKKIGLYVLGLQEIVDLNITKEYMGRAVYTDSAPVKKWQAALEAAMPEGYSLVTSEQMTGLLLLVYASPEVYPSISNVSTKLVGTGLLGYFGNKGAVSTRLVLGEMTRMVFVNCHLASGATQAYLERRYWDASQIVSKTQFDPIVQAGVAEEEGAKIGDEDFSFWFGDLNFRLDGLPGDDIRRILTLHTQGEYGAADKKSSAPLDGNGIIVMRKSEDSDDDTTTASSTYSREESFDSESSLPDPDDFPEDPSQDPTSLQATLDSLLPHDQLKRTMTERKGFHDGWREGPITFLPTYKYDVGTVGLFDSSEKQRAPSWCDRILYRTRRDLEDYEKKLKDEAETKRKDEEMKARGIEEDDDVLFSYDPDTDGDEHAGDPAGVEYDEYDENDDENAEEVTTQAGAHDRISLDIYTSHQRITSSDHKPVISIFTLDYDAVVPELKAKVHSEVARELDRIENEGRPDITVVVDGSTSQNDSVLDLGDVSFMERKSRPVTIANTGGVSATFSFVEKPSTEEGDPATPSWITTSFAQADGEQTELLEKSVTLEPGETVLAIVDAQVLASSHVRTLNAARDKLEDVLVLRVEGGRDHFISVRGVWLPTCFGRSIEELIRVPEGGMRKFLATKAIKGSIPYDSDVQCSAPRELFKITEAVEKLAERCVADEVMLEEMMLPRDPGWPFDASTWTAAGLPEQEALKAVVINALDNDEPILEALPVDVKSPQRMELLSSILLLFLESLTDGLIPSHLWAKITTAVPNLSNVPPSAWPDTKTQILDVLSLAPNHNIAFVFVTATLSRVAAELSPTQASSGLPPSLSKLGRRLSLRKVPESEGTKQRRARERRYAEIFAALACRGNEREKGARDKQRLVMEMFVRRDDVV
ncbi:Inositol polyphosphate 5-phosphatase OCRL-1 [Paramyrothecium foliicola]|nr:Inositol polyphosphate 5-phosphatase OCRL-1 [Paramyrothecium foliicola]